MKQNNKNCGSKSGSAQKQNNKTTANKKKTDGCTTENCD